jgi:hypothetical protein
MGLIIDKPKDFSRANSKGFIINGQKYRRLLGTNGGVKNSTVIYVTEDVYNTLNKRLNNGRDMTVPFVPAKLESYKALTCSGSIPVSFPNGVLVVNDCETRFKSDIIKIDDEADGEPVLTYEKDQNVNLMDSDGYGLIDEELSKKWHEELLEEGICSGFCIRNSWCKGMVFTFPFKEFAKDIAHEHLVNDAWGNDVDINKVQLILTTSMLKLWNCYKSWEDYRKNCEENHYTFSVTKCCPNELENERNLNYQFLQSYHLSDEQLEELLKPTIDEIHDVLGGDYRKSILFLKGMFLNDDNVENIDCDFVKALMIDKRMMDDPFVKSKIHQMIKKRITEAKIGTIKCHANFSIISGDPYSLCQSMFGMEVTGLLKSGEVYNKYWIDENADKVVCFRAPMTCHNNIRVLHMKNTSRILPVIYPPINAYPHKGALFSMLMAREECKPWVFSNFIQIYALKDLYNRGMRTGTVDFFYNLYGDWTYFHLKANPWIRINSMPFEFFKLIKSDIVDFIKTCINKNLYLFFDIDMYYIPAYKLFFNKNHLLHEIFIYGYDDDKNVFYMGDNTTGKYNHDQVTYEEITTSTNALLEMYGDNNEDTVLHNYREKSIYMMSIGKNVERNGQDPFFSKDVFEINIKKIINDLKEYLLLDNYAEGYKYSNYYVYGIDCYNELVKFVSYAMETNQCVDRRAFYSFIEHKKLMLLRMEFINGNYDLNRLIERYSNLVNGFNILMALVLKANNTKANDLWERIIVKLKEYKEEEIVLLNELIRILS